MTGEMKREDYAGPQTSLSIIFGLLIPYWESLKATKTQKKKKKKKTFQILQFNPLLWKQAYPKSFWRLSSSPKWSWYR